MYTYVYTYAYNIVFDAFLSTGIEIFLTLSLLFALTYIVYEQNKINNNLFVDKTKIISHLLILVFSLIVFLAISNPYQIAATFSGTFILDEYSSFIKIVLSLFSISILILSYKYFHYSKNLTYEYILLIGFALLGIFLITSSNDIISIYLALELQSLSFYILAASERNSEYSTEAGFKYFALSSFSSGFLLLGFSILYGLTGSTNLEFINKFIIMLNYQDTFVRYGISIAIILILASLFFKVGGAPFHMWLPDVYEGSPTAITAFFAIIPKIAIILLITRLTSNIFFSFNDIIVYLIIAVSILSMIIASLAALYQTKIKRLLAYSAIGHIGYILIGLSTITTEGLQSVLFYILIYMIMSVNIFTTIISIRDVNYNNEIKYINEFNSLSIVNPLLAFTLTIVLFSMAGIPPLAGFFSKLYIFSSAINVHSYFLAIVGVFTSVIAAVYYIYVIKVMYFSKAQVIINLKQMDLALAILISSSTLIIILLFLDCTWLLEFAHELSIYLTN